MSFREFLNNLDKQIAEVHLRQARLYEEALRRAKSAKLSILRRLQEKARRERKKAQKRINYSSQRFQMDGRTAGILYGAINETLSNMFRVYDLETGKLKKEGIPFASDLGKYFKTKLKLDIPTKIENPSSGVVMKKIIEMDNFEMKVNLFTRFIHYSDFQKQKLFITPEIEANLNKFYSENNSIIVPENAGSRYKPRYVVQIPQNAMIRVQDWAKSSKKYKEMGKAITNFADNRIFMTDETKTQWDDTINRIDENERNEIRKPSFIPSNLTSKMRKGIIDILGKVPDNPDVYTSPDFWKLQQKVRSSNLEYFFNKYGLQIYDNYIDVPSILKDFDFSIGKAFPVGYNDMTKFIDELPNRIDPDLTKIPDKVYAVSSTKQHYSHLNDELRYSPQTNVNQKGNYIRKGLFNNVEPETLKSHLSGNQNAIIPVIKVENRYRPYQIKVFEPQDAPYMDDLKNRIKPKEPEPEAEVEEFEADDQKDDGLNIMFPPEERKNWTTSLRETFNQWFDTDDDKAIQEILEEESEGMKDARQQTRTQMETQNPDENDNQVSPPPKNEEIKYYEADK